MLLILNKLTNLKIKLKKSGLFQSQIDQNLRKNI